MRFLLQCRWQNHFLREEWPSRANLGFTLPLYEFLTMRLNIEWINDSNPDPSIGNNKTQTN